MKMCVTIAFLLICASLSAQQTGILKIATNDRVAVQFSTAYSFEFNGKLYRMPMHALWEIPFSGDSVHIRLIDKRIARSKPEELHIAAKDEVKVFMFFAPYKTMGNSAFRLEENCDCFKEAEQKFRPIKNSETDGDWIVGRVK